MIGPEELSSCIEIKYFLDLHQLNNNIPTIPYDETLLQETKDSHLLILIIPNYVNGEVLDLLTMKHHFGTVSSDETVPCFYNQDWYDGECFAKTGSLSYRWCLVRKKINDDTRARKPEDILKMGFAFPSALLCAYTFFVYFLVTKEILWESEFIWCSDLDSNGDRIYVGRYKDPVGIAKDGFSIHRHLNLRNHYGAISIQ